MKSAFLTLLTTVCLNVLIGAAPVLACKANCSEKKCSCNIVGNCNDIQEKTLKVKIKDFERNCGKTNSIKNRKSNRSLGGKSFSNGAIKIVP